LEQREYKKHYDIRLRKANIETIIGIVAEINAQIMALRAQADSIIGCFQIRKIKEYMYPMVC